MYTDRDWDLLTPHVSADKAARDVTSPQDFHRWTAPGWLPRKSHNGILRYLLTSAFPSFPSPFMPKLLPHVGGLTPCVGVHRHLEKSRPLGDEPFRLLIPSAPLSHTDMRTSSSVPQRNTLLPWLPGAVMADQLSCHHGNCQNGS